jgi:hypothetical protein
MPAEGNVNLIYTALGKKRASGPGLHQLQEKRGSGINPGPVRGGFLIAKKSRFFLTGKTTSFYKS